MVKSTYNYQASLALAPPLSADSFSKAKLSKAEKIIQQSSGNLLADALFIATNQPNWWAVESIEKVITENAFSSSKNHVYNDFCPSLG